MNTSKSLRRRSTVLFTGLVFSAAAAHAQINPSSSTTNWNAVLYPPSSPTVPDPFSDQQTGNKEGDIVGTASVASFYTKFFNGGTPSLTDGQLAFRLRMAEEQTPTGFSTAAFVGIDGNADGRLDLFIGVDNSGSFDHVGIWRAGAGQNVSPSTTSLISPPAFTYSEVAVNYSWTPVNAAIDPTTISYDIDNGGNVDHFLSFVVLFADVVAMFGTVGISGINEASIFRYVVATATQDNSLNQDLNGVTGGINSTSTWSSLGGFSTPTSVGGTAVPEPSTYGLLGLSFAGWWLFRGRRRK